MATALEIVQGFFPRVESVVDAKTPLVFEVTARDANPKAKKNHNHCAVAEACKRKLHLDGAIVARTRAYLIKGRTAKRYNIPTSVQKEIISFDRGAVFEPGVYQLAAPAKSERLMGHRQGTLAKKAGKRGKKRFHHQTDGIRVAIQGG